MQTRIAGAASISTLIACLGCWTAGAARSVEAAIVYQSATMGVAGREGGVSVGTQVVGARFRLDTTVIIGSVGGHVGQINGTMFAAILALGGSFPVGAPTR
jgi:hypothetical protein